MSPFASSTLAPHLDRGRLEIGALEPNQSKDIELAFGSRKDLDLSAIALELSVGDANVGATQTQRLDITLGKPVAEAQGLAYTAPDQLAA